MSVNRTVASTRSSSASHLAELHDEPLDLVEDVVLGTDPREVHVACNSTNVAPTMRSAVRRLSSTGKSGSPLLAITRVGTWIDASAWVR